MEKPRINISKLISYWLRHNPSDAGTELDEFGWTDLDSIINALESKGIAINKQELVSLNNTFDKVRWKIDLENNKIKATHGHSIPVILEESETKPPNILYHGTGIKFIENIILNGLISKNRQFVHLSENISLAHEVGSRHGQPFVIEVDSLKLFENGWKFYKTEQNVWLTKNIPNQYLSFEPWKFNLFDEEIASFKKELIKEIGKKHELYDHLNSLKLIARHNPSDDCLFEDISNGNCYVAHLTWTSKKEKLPWPTTKKYNSINDWITKRLYEEHKDWY